MHTDQQAVSHLIVGLGNPGPEYRETRHNVGFLVVEELADRHGAKLREGECRCLTASVGNATLAQPLTFMNRSGFAVRCLSQRLRLDPEQILVVYDEIALPLGRLRLRPGGSPAGHRGMESVVNNLRTTQVPRLRLGIGREDEPVGGGEMVDYVLSPFRASERSAAEEMVLRAADACELWQREPIEQAMNQVNGLI